MTQHQAGGCFSWSLSSPQPLPRLHKSPPSPAPQPRVSVHIRKVLWTRFSEEKQRPQRGERAEPLRAPLLLALHSLGIPPGCPLWAQSFVTVDSYLESPATSSPVDLLSTVRNCACPQGRGSVPCGFPLLNFTFLQGSSALPGCELSHQLCLLCQFRVDVIQFSCSFYLLRDKARDTTVYSTAILYEVSLISSVVLSLKYTLSSTA